MTDQEHVQVAVAFLGRLDDCKYVMELLSDAGIECVMDVAERLRPDLAKHGYYLVGVPVALAEQARAAIEQQTRRDLGIDEPSTGEGDAETCPACGTLLPVGCASCPDCGLMFE
jgi:hypothetical protein